MWSRVARKGEAPISRIAKDFGISEPCLQGEIRADLRHSSGNTTWEAEAATRLLLAAGIPSLGLLDYTGMPVDAVKVGTVKRAKGLEFKVVMLPWTPSRSPGGDAERAARDVRERYVAATRAPDLLWVGSC